MEIFCQDLITFIYNLKYLSKYIRNDIKKCSIIHIFYTIFIILAIFFNLKIRCNKVLYIY